MSSPKYFDLLPAELILRIGELAECSTKAHTARRQERPTYFDQTFRGEWRNQVICLGSGCKISDLSSLARTCQRHHILINPLLHRRELEDYRAFGLFWAAKNGRLDTLDNFLHYGGRAYTNFTAFAGPMFSSDVCYKNDYLILRLFPITKEREGEEKADGFWDQWDKWWIHHQYRPHLYDWKFSLLALAAMGGHNEIVARLLDCGADIHAPSNTLCACEKFAAYNPRAAARVLTTADNYYLEWAPIHYAVCRGHLSTTNLLLSRGARHDRELVTHGPNTYSILYTAAFAGQLPILEFLLLHAGVAGREQSVKEGAALQFAVLCMCLKGIFAFKKLVVESGAEIESDSAQPSSVTGLQCLAGSLEAALLLLNRVAETNEEWRFHREISEEDLTRALQMKFEDLLMSRPLPEYPDYSSWKEKQFVVLQILGELKDQIENPLRRSMGQEPSKEKPMI